MLAAIIEWSSDNGVSVEDPSRVLLYSKEWCFSLTLLLVDLELNVEVDAGDNEVAANVDGANKVEHVLIFEGDLLGDLHHTKDDHKVGADPGS